MEIINIDDDFENSVNYMKLLIRNNKVIIYPTDTVYGIGGNGFSEEVVNRIYEAKNRSKHNSFSIIVSDYKMIKKICYVNQKEEELIKKYLPGPYTLLLRKRIDIASSKNEKVGIRIPENLFLNEVMKDFFLPLISTSANLSGSKTASILNDLSEKILDKVDCVFYTNNVLNRKSSTVIDIVDGSEKIIRK